MIPAFLIPLLVQVASKAIEVAFNAATKKNPAQQVKIFEKIERLGEERNLPYKSLEIRPDQGGKRHGKNP